MFACLLGYFYFILFYFWWLLGSWEPRDWTDYLRYLGKNLKTRSKNSTFKFDKYCKLGFVSCSTWLIFFCHNLYDEMELAFHSLLCKKAHYIHFIYSFWVLAQLYLLQQEKCLKLMSYYFIRRNINCHFLVIMGDKSKASSCINQIG